MMAVLLDLVPHQHPIPRMNNNRYIDDETIPINIGDVPTRVGNRDLVRVDPGNVLSAF